jgi:hypothetical protein
MLLRTIEAQMLYIARRTHIGLGFSIIGFCIGFLATGFAFGTGPDGWGMGRRAQDLASDTGRHSSAHDSGTERAGGRLIHEGLMDMVSQGSVRLVSFTSPVCIDHMQPPC